MAAWSCSAPLAIGRSFVEAFNQLFHLRQLIKEHTVLAQQLSVSDDGDVSDISQELKSDVIDLVYRHSGIHLGDLTCQFVQTRLRRRLRAVEISSADDYIAFVDRNADEAQHLVNAFTTNETCFFRTKPLWTFLEETFFPELANRPAARMPSFWSAACSTGEEAYSLAMLSKHVFPVLPGNLRPRILATDISTEVLEKAAEGVYSGRNINRLKAVRPDVLDSCFEARDGAFEVAAEIRKPVQFARHNLMEKAPQQDAHDLVMLRNVLIYFSQDDQMKIVRNIVASMRSGGVLAIGESESLSFFDSGLDYVQPFVYRKP